MAKQKEEIMEFDDSPIEEVKTQIIVENNQSQQIKSNKKVKQNKEDKPLINCLRNEKVRVQFVPRRNSITNKKHMLYGGMIEGAKKRFCVPMLASGLYANVLTNDEKNYLEYIMGLEDNALSIYNKVNNFWDTSNPEGVNTVELTKDDTFLDLSSPTQYIQYKILLANKNFICPSLQELQDRPKATYQYVIVEEGKTTESESYKIDALMEAFDYLKKHENDTSLLRYILELIEGRPISANTKNEYIKNRLGTIIQTDSRIFINTIKDPYLDIKVLIKEAKDAGIIIQRGDYYYDSLTNTPLCNSGENPVLSIAAKYLANPKNQEKKFAIESRLKK